MLNSVELTFGPSRIQQYCQWLATGLGLLAVLQILLVTVASWLVWSLMLVAMIVSVMVVARSQKCTSTNDEVSQGHGCQRLRYDGHQWWWTSTANQAAADVYASDGLPVRLLGSSWVSGWLIILHIQPPGRRLVVLPVFRDSVSTEQFRRLRILLKHGEPLASVER